MIKMLNFDTNTDDFDKFRAVNNNGMFCISEAKELFKKEKEEVN